MTASSRLTHIASSLDNLRRVIRVLRLGARQAEEHTGLSPAQLFVLGQIAAADRQSLTELAARTMTDRTSVAAMVERLAERGLVERVQGVDDRRRIEARLTPAGHRTLSSAPSSPTQELLDGLERIDDDTLAQLARGLDALVGAIGAGEGPVPFLFEEPIAPRTSDGASRPAAGE